MPWKASSVMDERTRFVLEHERKLYTMTELCEIYDIARETGYYWLRRYQQGGLEALQDRDRAPGRHPNQTTERIEESVLMEGVSVGAETHITGTIVSAHAAIGAHCHLSGVMVGHKVTLGDGNELTSGARVFAGVNLPDGAIRF